MILGTHRLTKVPVAIKVIFNDVNIEVDVADLPEVAISGLLYKQCSVVRMIEHFKIGPYIYLVQAGMSHSDL